MSAKIDDGGPAFPRAALDSNRMTIDEQGMTLRDWFAGQALQGYLAGPAYGTQDADKLAKGSYQCADAMIAVRKGTATHE